VRLPAFRLSLRDQALAVRLQPGPKQSQERRSGSWRLRMPSPDHHRADPRKSANQGGLRDLDLPQVRTRR
jgi:hypothetical protein